MTRQIRHHLTSWQARALLAFALAAATSLCGQQNAAAQVQVVNSIRLELRIQPQIGHPADPEGVIDVPGTAHHAITGPGQLRRFEVQYRLLDLDPADAVIPVSIISFEFMIAFTGGGNAALGRAVLSRDEAQGTPSVATSPDRSGLPTWATTPARQSRGLHAPFMRTIGHLPDFPFNNCPENGRFAPGAGGPDQSIQGIVPIELSESPSFVLGAWHGLYSFDFISGSELGGDVALSAAIVAPPPNVAFSFFRAGSLDPTVSDNAASEPATISIPAPGPFAVGAVVLIGVGGRMRRRGPPDGAARGYAERA